MYVANESEAISFASRCPRVIDDDVAVVFKGYYYPTKFMLAIIL